MASPAEAANGISTPPPTTASAPPTAARNTANSPSTLTAPTPNPNSQTQNGTSTTTAPPAVVPRTSTNDAGASKRPRDQRILHLVLSTMGVQAYEERVPLMLQDFAYRYQVGILTDAVALSPETTNNAGTGTGRNAQEPTVSQAAIRQAISSRVQNQFNPVLPKDWLLELAQEKNRVMLPKVEREFGVRLPPERYCLTGTSWGLKDEWDSEEDEPDHGMPDVDVEMGEDEQEGDNFEDVMGRGEDAMET